MIKKALKSGLAALLLATASTYSSEPVNQNHSNWLKAVETTQKIREKSPQRMGKLEKEIFEQARTYNPTDSSTSKLADYSEVRQSDIVDIFVTNAHYTTQVVLDLTQRLNYDWSKVDPAKRKEFIETNARKLESNPDFQKYVASTRNKENVDCKLFSSIAAAMYLSMDNNAEVELVTGLFFDKKHAPTGMGHQWTKAKGQIIDPAIEIPTGKENYIPLMAVKIKHNGQKYILSPQIYCLTPEMQKRIK